MDMRFGLLAKGRMLIEDVWEQIVEKNIWN
jgi:hypothetical protein